MTVVSNTGPIVALAKADLLPLLQVLYTAILIPPAVHRELLARMIRGILENIRRRGYWLSDALVETAARLAGES